MGGVEGFKGEDSELPLIPRLFAAHSGHICFLWAKENPLWKSKGKQKRGILSLFFLHSYFQFALERTHKAFTGSQAAYRFLRHSTH